MYKWDKKILVVLLKWDYGDPEKGDSLEKIWFLNNINKLVNQVYPFWYDKYLTDEALLQNNIKLVADEIHPDLIFFIPFRDQFKNGTLKYLKDKYTTIAWFGDDQWRFKTFTKNIAPNYTFSITTDRFSVENYKNIGITPIVSQWAAESSKDYVNPNAEGIVYKYDVSFVGARNEVRSWFIKKLKKYGIDVTCFGRGWESGRLSALEMEDVFRTSKINLNISNSVNNDITFVLGGVLNIARWLVSKKNEEQIKARNFEIPLVGGFQLSNYVIGLEEYFNIGSEIAIYSNVNDCAKQINYYLNNELERKNIAALGFVRANHEHRFINRLEKIFSQLWRKP